MYVRDLIGHRTEESEIIALLQGKSAQGEHNTIVKGLVYGVLAGHDWLNYLLLTSRDQFSTACSTLACVFGKLKFPQRAFWLFEQLWRVDSASFPDLFVSLLRNTDLTQQIMTKIEWVSGHPLMGLVFYKVLRQASFLVQEASPLLQDISRILSVFWQRQREDCLKIGRDLMRLVSYLSEVSAINVIWNDLNQTASEGSPLYWKVLCSPTHPKYHSVLLPTEVEKKLVFVIENSNQKNYTRYLKWLMEDCKEHKLSDIVRFIVTYPCAKELTPRWQVAAWFLTSAQNHQVQASIKQALVFDCLFYSSQDSFYTVEPVMSLLQFLLNKCTSVAEELLEFILSSAELYDKSSTVVIMRNVRECFTMAHRQGVISSLESLTCDQRLDEGLRNKLFKILEVPSNGQESAAYEETSFPAPRALMDWLGEAGVAFANEPNIKDLQNIVYKVGVVNQDLANFVLKCITHEYIQEVSVEKEEVSLLHQVFVEAETDSKLKDLLKAMYSIEGAVGIRYLIYCLKTDVSRYLKVDPQLDRDIKAGLLDQSLEVFNWVFPRVFKNLNSQVTPSTLHFFLQCATPELVFNTELDLLCNSYSLLSSKLPQVLEKSYSFSSTERLYLWKLILAEVEPEQLGTILTHFRTSLSSDVAPYENFSGLLNYIFRHTAHITAQHVRQLLELPAKHYRSPVFVGLSRLKSAYVEEAVLQILHKPQFHSQVNVLKHMKYWVEHDGKLSVLIKTAALQEALTNTLNSLSSEYFKEFSSLLETSKNLYSA